MKQLLTTVLLGVFLSAVALGQSPSVPLVDNFTQNHRLNTALWTDNSNFLNALATGFSSSFITPQLSFSPLGMKMTGISQDGQLTGVQSLKTFTAPFIELHTRRPPEAKQIRCHLFSGQRGLYAVSGFVREHEPCIRRILGSRSEHWLSVDVTWRTIFTSDSPSVQPHLHNRTQRRCRRFRHCEGRELWHSARHTFQSANRWHRAILSGLRPTDRTRRSNRIASCVLGLRQSDELMF